MFGLDYELLGKDPTESNFKQNQNLLVHIVRKPEGRVDWIDLVVTQKNRSQNPQAEFPSDLSVNLKVNSASGTASAFASSTLSR